MQVNLLSTPQKGKWNAFVSKEPSFTLTQSWEWGEFKEELGWKVFRVLVEEQNQIVAGAQLLIKSLPLSVASVAYVPRGPIGNWLDKPITDELFSKLHQIAKMHKAIYLKIEPPLLNDPNVDQVLKSYKFRSSPHTNQPRSTIVVDLTASLDEIFNNMNKSTKRYIKYGEKQGLVVRKGDHEDLASFYNLMKITGRRGQFSIRSLDYYKQEWETFVKSDQALLLVASFQDQILAFHIAYSFGDYAAYFHGASSGDHSELHPNKLLVWEAIKWAKEKGCRSYDLWGIPDEIGQAVFDGQPLPMPDRTDGLWGVYHFKMGFSKEIRFFMGAYDYVYSSLPYSLSTNKFINSNKFEQVLALFDRLRDSDR